MFTPKKIYLPLYERLVAMGLTEATELQAQAFPILKSGSDLWINAPEKTGKTTLSAIFVLHKLKVELEEEDVPRAIVIVPTKERVLEYKELLETMGKFAHLRIKCAYSEEDLERQRNEVYAGSDVVVGTAKRLGELYSGTGLNIRLVNTIIIDDFDKINKQDALAQIERLLTANPKIQKVYMTTTQPSLIRKIIEKVSLSLREI